MKIDQYDLSLASTRVYEQEKQKSEELREWGTSPGRRKNRGNPVHTRHDRVNLSREARMAMASHGQQTSMYAQKPCESMDDISGQGMDAKLITLKRMIEALTGKEINVTQMKNTSEQEALLSEQVPKDPPAETGEVPREQAWGMSYTYLSTYRESEQTSFSAAGIVHTSDGRDISFSIGLTMSREYFSEDRLEIMAGAPMTDPLVINYGVAAADLDDLTFEFDLNSDGSSETLRRLAPGSGFLVFDKNEDGRVNDGRELFGPNTGDGFDELSAYDEDGNRWIDENDSIYDKLTLWRRENEQDILVDLKSANVGAIYLGNAETSFDLTDPDKILLGRIRKTGVYLKEDGGVGTVQQVDYAV